MSRMLHTMLATIHQRVRLNDFTYVEGLERCCRKKPFLFCDVLDRTRLRVVGAFPIIRKDARGSA
jgi:hypothetical protein